MKVKIYTFWPRKWTSRPKISAIRHQFHQNRIKIGKVRDNEKNRILALFIPFCYFTGFLIFAFFNQFGRNWCLTGIKGVIVSKGIKTYSSPGERSQGYICSWMSCSLRSQLIHSTTNGSKTRFLLNKLFSQMALFKNEKTKTCGMLPKA